VGSIPTGPTTLTSSFFDPLSAARSPVVHRLSNQPSKAPIAAAAARLGQNRRNGKSPGFVQSVINAIESFYGDVLQNLTAYQPKAPKLASKLPEEPPPELPTVPLIEAGPSSAPLSRAIALPPAPSTWYV
jgi:hypothetical protein